MEPQPRVPAGAQGGQVSGVEPHKALVLGPSNLMMEGPKAAGGLTPKSHPLGVHSPGNPKGMPEVEPQSMNPLMKQGDPAKAPVRGPTAPAPQVQFLSSCSSE